MTRLLISSAILLLLTACIPKAQYDTVVTQRDYYQQQSLQSDSIAQARTLDRSDSLGQSANFAREQVRKLEDLTATNRSLRESLEDTRNRYEILLEQNSELLSASGSDVMDLQQDLRDRSAELSKREAAVQRADRELQARAEQLSSLGKSTANQGTNPVDPASDAAVDLARLYDELGQLMLAATDTGYILEEPAGNTMKLVLDEDLLFTDSLSLSLDGQRLLRKLSATLRNYPRATYLIIGHAESVDGNIQLAYETSLRRSVNVALHLGRLGMDAGRIVAGGMGFYGSDQVAAAATGQPGERRTEIVIGMQE